jgi:hypothetical protein
MDQDVGKFGLHQGIWVLSGIFLGVDASPRWTNYEGVSLKRLNLQKVLVDELQPVEALVIDFHVVLQHSELIWVQVVDNILFEMFTEVNRDPSDSGKGFEDLLDSHTFKTILEVMGDGFGDD